MNNWKEQKYFCEKCGLESSVQFEEHEDVMSVAYRIQDDHDEKSPDCDNEVCKIRINK